MHTVIVQVVKHDYTCIFPFLSSTVHVYCPNPWMYKEKFKASYLPEIISSYIIYIDELHASNSTFSQDFN